MSIPGFSLITIFFQPCCCCCTGCRAPSRGKISSLAFQATTCSICRENLWNYSRQLEEGVGIFAFLMHSGILFDSPLSFAIALEPISVSFPFIFWSNIFLSQVVFMLNLGTQDFQGKCTKIWTVLWERFSFKSLAEHCW